jgi:hypothetical protein
VYVIDVLADLDIQAGKPLLHGVLMSCAESLVGLR